MNTYIVFDWNTNKVYDNCYDILMDDNEKNKYKLINNDMLFEITDGFDDDGLFNNKYEENALITDDNKSYKVNIFKVHNNQMLRNETKSKLEYKHKLYIYFNPNEQNNNEINFTAKRKDLKLTVNDKLFNIHIKKNVMLICVRSKLHNSHILFDQENKCKKIRCSICHYINPFHRKEDIQYILPGTLKEITLNQFFDIRYKTISICFPGKNDTKYFMQVMTYYTNDDTNIMSNKLYIYPCDINYRTNLEMKSAYDSLTYLSNMKALSLHKIVCIEGVNCYNQLITNSGKVEIQNIVNASCKTMRYSQSDHRYLPNDIYRLKLDKKRKRNTTTKMDIDIPVESVIVSKKTKPVEDKKSYNDIVDFLISKDLFEYVNIFEEEEIYLSDLPFLNNEDIKKIFKNKIGPMNRFINALKSL